MTDVGARTAPPPIDARTALFLDVDGTLVDFGIDPARVRPTDETRAILEALEARLGGALALVSGRPVAALDAMFSPLRLRAAGLHGHELRREPRGTIARAALDHAAMAALSARVEAWHRLHPEVFVEHKGASLALHYRAHPSAREAVESFATEALAGLSGQRVQRGDHVVEFVPEGGDKGRAVEELLTHAAFRDRAPIFVGDDLTDEFGFVAARRAGGFGVLVGSPRVSAARFSLADPAAVVAWLRAGLEALEASASREPPRGRSPRG